MKKFLFLGIFFFFAINNVSAQIEPQCLDDNSCLALCNYKTTIEFGGSYATDYLKTTEYRDLTIYYNFNDSSFTAYWQKTDKDGKVKSKNGAINYVFSTSGTKVYWETGEAVNISNFKCPSYGYLDTSDANPDNELCFDNDGSTCINNKSNMGTAFGKHGGFVSTEKDLDFETDIKNYNVVADIVQDITNGTFNVKEDFVKKIENDFKTNFLHGHDLPQFIANSTAYQNITAKAEKDFEEAKAKALKEAQDSKKDTSYVRAQKEVQLYCGSDDEDSKAKCEHAQSIIDEANKKAEQIKDNWDADPSEIGEQAGVAISNINMSVNWNSNFEVDSNCDSYLGNPNTPGKPAYYMQFIFNLMKYVAIILLFALSIVDFTKAITSSNQDALKKASITAVKRLIIVVIIFFLPNLIKFLLTVLGAYSPDTCGIS